MALVFAVTTAVGFASTNISGMNTGACMAARDRECRGRAGTFCREREAAVADSQVLDAAMASVGQVADPQTDAAIRLLAWGSRRMLRPTAEDFAMMRLILLALLPQIGGK
jgi:hypothetical protein